MTALIRSWTNRLKEYEGESIDYLTIALCFIQCWKLQYNLATQEKERFVQERAVASTSNTERVPRSHDKQICFENPARAQQRRIIQFHKAQIASQRAKIRFWFFYAIRSGRKEAAQQEFHRLENDYNWLIYDWFCIVRPIPLPSESQHPAVDSRYLDQCQSPFFKLPAEIRQLIYKAHLTGITINLTLYQAGQYGPSGYESRACLDWSRLEREEIRYFAPSWRQSRMLHRLCPRRFVDFGIVNFLLTCKRIHTKAVPVVYGENLWTHSVEFTWLNSLPLTKYLLPKQLHNVYWLQFDLNLGGDLNLGMLDGFPNLRKLDIRAFDFNSQSQFTARQLWQRLESVFLVLEKLTSTRVTIFVEDCIPVGSSPFTLVPLKTDVGWFFGDYQYSTDKVTGELVLPNRLRSEGKGSGVDVVVPG